MCRMVAQYLRNLSAHNLRNMLVSELPDPLKYDCANVMILKTGSKIEDIPTEQTVHQQR